MNKILISTFLIAASLTAQNLTPAQKEGDFRYLAGLFAGYYAPVDWKKQVLGYDMTNLKPWLDKVAKTQTDLDFYEVQIEYINSLSDTHVSFGLPSDFAAQLGFQVDFYDGALLVEAINRTLLPANRYPFAIGDELVSIDGVDAKQIVQDLIKYVPQGNPRAQQRQVAQRLGSRFQSRFPHAPDLPDTVTVIIKRQNGSTDTYTMTWVKTGTPLTVGPIPGFKLTTAREKQAGSDEPDYTAPLRQLQFSGILDKEELQGVLNFGSRTPIFVNGLGSTFTRRLGGSAADFFYSGTFKRDDLTFGYIRIPNYAPPSNALALQQLEAEINYMNTNTDGLILDEMRNTGGDLCFGQQVARRIINYPFQATGFATRPLWFRVLGFYNSVLAAKNANAGPDVIQQYETIYNEILAAAKDGRTVTNPLPICSPTLTLQPAAVSYSKPVILLIDEFSMSTADSFAAMFQDANRGLTYGYRTNGAGGNNITLDAGMYSEFATGMTIALQTRQSRSVAGYPTSIYFENVGVHPDFIDDYMTRDNLLNGGAPFVQNVLQAMYAYTKSKQ